MGMMQKVFYCETSTQNLDGLRGINRIFLIVQSYRWKVIFFIKKYNPPPVFSDYKLISSILC